jgi:hypothetical protein
VTLPFAAAAQQMPNADVDMTHCIVGDGHRSALEHVNCGVL